MIREPEDCALTFEDSMGEDTQRRSQKMASYPQYPFTAVVGQDQLRLALLLNAVHPGIGGVLARGEKGTAKSTVVRALASLLPHLDQVDGCRFRCDPTHPDADCPDGPHHATVETVVRPAALVELPVGATEDRLLGSLDLEAALQQGKRAFHPGLLATAHRGVLYVDEVNLLPDHLVDVLLDAAAMGRAHVERESVSISHASKFLLVGTMNPEEGELRPQLLDRFGLTVEVNADRDVDTRVEVIRRRLAFEENPAEFVARWRKNDEELAAHIVTARARLADVTLPDLELRRIASVCAAFDVDGMRADLVVARTSVAHAAWRGASEVTEDDVEVAVRLALPHRRRRDPFDEPGLAEDQLSDALEQAKNDLEPDDEPEPDPDPSGGSDVPDAPEQPSGSAPQQSGTNPTPPFKARFFQVPGAGVGTPGKRSKARTTNGRVVRSSQTTGTGLHVIDTVLAAAPKQHSRGRDGAALKLVHSDVRKSVREGKEGNLIVFLVDASGSMAARKRMDVVTGAVISLLRDAYQRRDKVAVITFRGTTAEVALPPTNSVDVAATRLRKMRTGGRTPLAAGYLAARKLVMSQRVSEPGRRPLVVTLTDGRATSGVSAGDPSAQAHRAAAVLAADNVANVVVDCENGPVRLGFARSLAVASAGAYVQLAELSADAIKSVVVASRAA